MNKTIDIISLGCSKNLVDSEVLMGLMEANGYQCTHDSEDPQGDIVVVNTCGFINDAKEEKYQRSTGGMGSSIIRNCCKIWRKTLLRGLAPAISFWRGSGISRPHAIMPT